MYLINICILISSHSSTSKYNNMQSSSITCDYLWRSIVGFGSGINITICILVYSQMEMRLYGVIPSAPLVPILSNCHLLQIEELGYHIHNFVALTPKIKGNSYSVSCIKYSWLIQYHYTGIVVSVCSKHYMTTRQSTPKKKYSKVLVSI